MDKKLMFAIVALAIIAVAGAGYFYFASSLGKEGALALCLTQKGAKMYGAFWCSHCAEQKKMFGDAFAKINYVECSEPNFDQKKECANAGIKSYPTWEFSNGARVEGVLSLSQLASLANCESG